MPSGVCHTFVLLDGVRADISFCGECADTADENLPKVWARVLGAFLYEQENRARINPMAMPLTVVQQRLQEDMMLKLIQNPPLGILYTRPLAEIAADAVA